MTIQISKDWRRSESRDVRPFSSTKAITDAMAHCAIRLKPADAFSQEESIKIVASEIGNLEPTIRLAIDPAALSALSASEMENLSCLVSLESNFLKRIDVLNRVQLSAYTPMEIEVPVELSRLLRVGSSTTICATLCLNKELPHNPGKAFHKGHWIAKKVFQLDVEKDSTAFSIEPLDEAVLKRFLLPQGSLYFINYVGGLNEPVVPESPPARVYVAKEVIDRLTLGSQQKNAASIESFLAAEISAAIVIHAFGEMGADEEVTVGSPLASFMKKLKEGFGISEKQLRSYATENEGIRLKAYLHADAQTVRNILAN